MSKLLGVKMYNALPSLLLAFLFKLKARIRLTIKQEKINLKNTFVKIHKKREALILAFSGYTRYELASALTSASFMLIVVKINYYCLCHHQIPLKFNLLLFTGLLGLNLIYNLHIYIRFLMYKVIRKTLSKYFFGLEHCTWKQAKLQMDEKEQFVEGVQNDALDIIKLPIDTWFHTFALSIFTLLIQFRLFMLSEPYLFFFGRFIVFYWLLVNKYLIFSYFISLIVLLSGYTLLFQDNDMANWRKHMKELEILRGEWVTIKATKINAFVILSAITITIRYRNVLWYDEEDHFYITKKKLNPKFKFIIKYIKPGYTDICESASIVIYRLQNYFPKIHSSQYIYVETQKMNKNIIKLIKNIFLNLIILFLARLCVKTNECEIFLLFF